jgi:hypothetical protein
VWDQFGQMNLWLSAEKGNKQNAAGMFSIYFYGA